MEIGFSFFSDTLPNLFSYCTSLFVRIVSLRTHDALLTQPDPYHRPLRPPGQTRPGPFPHHSTWCTAESSSLFTVSGLRNCVSRPSRWHLHYALPRIFVPIVCPPVTSTNVLSQSRVPTPLIQPSRETGVTQTFHDTYHCTLTY